MNLAGVFRRRPGSSNGVVGVEADHVDDHVVARLAHGRLEFRALAAVADQLAYCAT
jgi:hypothetical protein